MVGKYSEFINFPIKLWDSREEEKEVPMNEEELAEQLRIEQEDAAAESDDDESEEEEVDLDEGDKESDSDDDTPKLPKKTTKTEYETVWEYQTLNDVKPLWTRSTDDITDEEYKEFYKSAMKEFLDPLKWTHFSAEGEVNKKKLFLF